MEKQMLSSDCVDYINILQELRNMKIFKPFGPFQIFDKEKEEGEFDDTKFWRDHPAIAKQQGCYVFAVRNRGVKPWYIGKTARTFKDEIFTPGKLAIYYAVLRGTNKGTPVFFFIAAPKQKGASPRNIIDKMESFLIGQGFSSNPRLKNKQKVQLPEFGIRGVIRGGMGKATESAKQFRKAMAME